MEFADIVRTVSWYSPSCLVLCNENGAVWETTVLFALIEMKFLEVSQMNLVVIGATGMIGKAVCDLAIKRGVPTLGTSSSNNRGYFQFRLEYDSPDIVLNNLCDNEACIVLAGAVSNINRCYKEQNSSKAINVEGTLRLIRACHDRGIKVTFLSSDAVFDGKMGNYTEDDETYPICVYGKQKKEVEEICLKEYPEVLIYRLSKQIDYEYSHRNLFVEWYKKYINREEIRCIDRLIFQPTYVKDIADCILRGLNLGLNGIYHVAAPEALSRQELVNEFFRIGGVCDANIATYPVEAFEFPEAKPLNTSMETEKFRRDVGYNFTDVRSVMQRFWKLKNCVLNDEHRHLI